MSKVDANKFILNRLTNITNAKFNTIFASRVPAGSTLLKAGNENGIANSNANNVKLLVYDTDISTKNTYTAADIASVQAAVSGYTADARVKGMFIRDEPTWYDL
jgi:hypothetical protein